MLIRRVGIGIFTVDLTSEWDYTEDKSQYNFVDFVPSNFTPAPNTCGGALSIAVYDGDLLLYGGAPLASNNSVYASPNLTTAVDQLWAFKTSSRAWTKPRNCTRHLQVSQHGTYTAAPDQQLLFYLDVSGLTMINTSSETITHYINVPSGLPKTGASMQYIESLGTNGALVLIGGALMSNNQSDQVLAGDLVSNSQNRMHSPQDISLIRSGINGHHLHSRYCHSGRRECYLVQTADVGQDTRVQD